MLRLKCVVASFAAACVWCGCAGRSAEESVPAEEPLTAAVGRLVRPDCFTAERAAAFLRDSLAEYRRNCLPDEPLPVAFRFETNFPAGDRRAARRAVRLERALLRHRKAWLEAGNMTETVPEEAPLVVLQMSLEVVPGNGIFLTAALNGGGQAPWNEALELADWEEND